MQRVELFGIRIDNVTMPEALEQVRRLLAGPGRHIVVTPNVDHVVRLARDEAFRWAYGRASLVVADGMPLIWASRLLGDPLKERVTGSDMVPQVCRLAEEGGYPIYLLGAMPGVAEEAIRRLRRRHPSLRIVGHYAPPLGFERDAEACADIVRRINLAKPAILLIGLGPAKQEKWIAQHLDVLDIRMAFCIGAGIDFLAGNVERAPRWMQRSGLEWLFRLAREPRRLWRRYLVEDMAFLGLFLRECRRPKARRPREAA
jgi:exopolysaccharide biosynthesis WecB/TagA/CpsF family protein